MKLVERSWQNALLPRSNLLERVAKAYPLPRPAPSRSNDFNLVLR